MEEKYETLDNGGTPFTVIIKDNKVFVYENNENKLVKEYIPSHIFIGKSVINDMTIFSGAKDDPKFDGNSILLELDPNSLEYVYIGECIYSFKAYSKIIVYESPVGNSSVPYPYAIDESRNFYLMTENIVLEATQSLEDKLHEGSDPYDYYYSNYKIGGYFEDFRYLKIDNEKYIFTFTTENFEDFSKRFNYSQISGEKLDGTEIYFTKETYQSLMDRFAVYRQFKKFLNKQMIHERI